MSRLVAASFELIRETGALEPRVSEILRRAGLSNQAFYRHFRSKDELLLCVLDEGVRMLASTLEKRVARAPTAEAKVRAWIGGVLEQALQPEAAAATRPFALSRARLSELFPSEVEASERVLAAPLRRALEAAAHEGGLSVSDAERDAEAIHTLAMGWVQRQLARPGTPSRADAAHVVEFARAALRGERAAPAQSEAGGAS